ncbi:hypothetical protein BS50DRAFT_603884 [Corynespora cassiicola Philippines]|uniref:Integral membrane protein n=1 Tax=Corynespora cassiicola Philippines TaxID=1448308 RepID=A0A2T2N8I1_CORCC|nr:hypothetical protein BS50DRAFT_603884 [Corynespora cassiicola Philippines]
MNDEFKIDPTFKAWGPFIPDTYENEPITTSDIIIAGTIFALTLANALLAMYLGFYQTIGSRSPIRSTYVWMIWLELLVSFLMGLECFLHLLKFVKPSFAFYFTILFWWCIQVQLLLQIIINRIRVIVPDRRRSKMIMIGTATVVTAINISVFNIWIPARLQISHRYVFINEIWDRIEKVLYLMIDAALNWYFLKVVKANLINNGLQKYYRLLRFNQRIIVLSLLMDVMIIAAMSIPNSFVYIQFHPLAYLVKLNIEMTMANLIKRIAVSSSRRTGNASLVQEFNSSNMSSSGPRSTVKAGRRSSVIELSSMFSPKSPTHPRNGRAISFAPTGNQIKKTEEITVHSEPNPMYDRDVEMGIGAAIGSPGKDGIVVDDRSVTKSKSLDDITEGGESVKSQDDGPSPQYPNPRDPDSDDEVALVLQGRGQWSHMQRR